MIARRWPAVLFFLIAACSAAGTPPDEATVRPKPQEPTDGTLKPAPNADAGILVPDEP